MKMWCFTVAIPRLKGGVPTLCRKTRDRSIWYAMSVLWYTCRNQPQ